MINVDLIYTSDFGLNNTVLVQNYLKQFIGPINYFIQSKKPVDKNNPINPSKSYRWVEINNLFLNYRKSYVKRGRRIVVLLSGIKYDYYLLSKNQDDDIYIHTEDWENLVDEGTNPLLPICHQVIENILQILMGIRTDADQEKFYHRQGEPCLNFWAKDKATFLTKLKSADICSVCKNHIDNIIDENTLSQINDTIENIRIEIRHLKKKSTPNEIKIKVSSDIKISIADESISFKELEAAIYTFFLIKKEGIRLNEIKDPKNQNLLFKIYRLAKRTVSADDFKDTSNSLEGSAFRKHRSEIKRKIKKLKWDELSLAPLFITGKKGCEYSIKFDRSNVIIDPKVYSHIR